MSRRRLATLAGLALAAAAPPLGAAEPDFFGTWLIAEARVAPWAQAGQAAFDIAEQHRLIGTKVTYAKTRITGPESEFGQNRLGENHQSSHFTISAPIQRFPNS